MGVRCEKCGSAHATPYSKDSHCKARHKAVGVIGMENQGLSGATFAFGDYLGD